MKKTRLERCALCRRHDIMITFMHCIMDGISVEMHFLAYTKVVKGIIPNAFISCVIVPTLLTANHVRLDGLLEISSDGKARPLFVVYMFDDFS